MRHTARTTVLLLVALLFTGCAQPEKTYYAIEMAGSPVGFIEIAQRPGETADDPKGKTTTHILMRLTLLGQPLDLTIHEERRFDPETGRVTYIEGEIRTAQGTIGATAEIDGNEVQYTPLGGAEASIIRLDPGVFLDEGEILVHLVEHFDSGDGEPITIKSFDPSMGRILERSYKLVEEQAVLSEGAEYECLLLEMENVTTGTSERQWIDPESEMLIRSESSDGTAMYLADSSIPQRIQRASIDSLILATVDAQIEDVQNISYMKVRAKIRSRGEVVTVEGLNVPGQSFEGIVEHNLIDGVFEIEHARYDGQNAPAFPPDFGQDPELQPYLGRGFLIDADDPVLIEKAHELTEGAENSWDATRRLASWVGEEIEGAIVLGSSRQVYDSRKGECAGHTRLFTAFARAVGIPARMVSGGTYTGIEGGSFGQHAWSEVWMGSEVGWVPLDTTFRESDYVDSGHIRLGGMTGFQPEEIEVLDYRVGLSH